MRLSRKIILLAAACLIIFGGFAGCFLPRGGRPAQAVFITAEVRRPELFTLYRFFMSWLASGVRGGETSLPQGLRQKLQPYYSNDLAAVRLAETVRISGLAVTDCSRVYFGDADIMGRLRRGGDLAKGQLRWLAHELAHTEQCDRWGGRQDYAANWFDEIGAELIKSWVRGGWRGLARDLGDVRGASFDDKMAMEVEADERADEVIRGWKP